MNSWYHPKDSARKWGMKAAFGDHAQVTVTRDGIQVDEYSHD